MKRRIALLLVICLLTSMVPAATAGGATGDGVSGNGIDIADVGDRELSMSLEPDGIELDDDDFLDGIGDILPEGDVPDLEMGDALALPESETLLSESEAQGDASEANDDSSDFTIENGVLTKYNGAGGDVVIPDGVTAIGDGAFYEQPILSITIPNSVKRIGRNAFGNCWMLKSIVIPDSVTEINEMAFNSCTALKEIAIPGGLTRIADSMFIYCSALTTVQIPDSVTEIGNEAFEHCGELSDVRFSDGLTSIGYGAFNGCSKLSSVTLPDSLKSIGEYAFDSSGLTAVTIPKNVTVINEFIFQSCRNLTEVVIPNGVTHIKANAFWGCQKLQKVTIPDSVVRIGQEAFEYCSSLEEAIIPRSVTKISMLAFDKCEKLTIKGFTGSAAEKYANENGIPFVAIDEPTPEISIPKALTLGVKETYALDAAGASFKSSNAAVAAVDKKGVVTAKKAGSATVTVTVGGKKVGTCKVTVVKAPTSISFAEKSVTLGVKETLALKPTITKGSHTSYTWSVKDKKIATVDKDGVVTGKKAGKTTVTVKTHNGKKATVTVTVQKAPTKVSLPKKAVTLGVKEALTLTPKIAKGAHTSFTWTVADSKIATVTKSGKVTGKKAGETTVTVKTHNGKKATVTVTVMKAPTAVSLEAKTMALGVKESVKLKPSIASDAHTSYTWTVKDKKIATVTKDGKLTGVKAGKTTVTVKTHNGKKATMTVNVMAAPGSITLSGKSRELTVGDAIMLMPTLPKKTASRITWSSSKKSVASVDASGVVRALKKGTAKITAKTFNGKKAVCTVTVGEGASYLAFDAEALSVGVKEKVGLKPQVNEGAKVKYTWSTGNKKVATVNKKGVVTGVKAGSADITVKTQNGLTATVKVTVLAAPSKVTLNKTKAELPVNQTFQLKATLPNKTASQIKWSTSDKKVATVDETGLVTAVAAGKATITAQTFNGKKATCVVTVREETTEDHFQWLSGADEVFGNTEFNVSELSSDMLSSEYSDGSDEMNQFIEEYNALTKEVNDSAEACYGCLEELTNILCELDDVLGKTTLSEGKGGIKVDNEMISFTIITEASNTVRNQSGTSTIRMNGIPVSIVPNGYEKMSAKELLDLAEKCVRWLGYAGDYFKDKLYPKLNEFGKKVSNGMGEQKNKVFNMNNKISKWEWLLEVEMAKPESNQKVIDGLQSQINQYQPILKRETKKLKNWGRINTVCEWLIKTCKGFIEKHVDAWIGVGNDLVKAKGLVEIYNHEHPVGREADDTVRMNHVQKWKDVKVWAIGGVFADISANIGLVMCDLLTLTPAGLAKKGVTKFLGPKMWKLLKGGITKIVNRIPKKLRDAMRDAKWFQIGAEVTVDTTVEHYVDKWYNEAEHEENILHGKIRGTISGKVIDADTKKPIAGALVETDEKSKITKADGSFVLSAMYGDYSGDYAVKCTKEGYEDGTGEVVVDEDNSDVEVTITIANNGEGTIKGKVVDKNTKKPLSGVKVECEYCDTATTNSKGQFTIKKVPTGYQTLVFTKEKYVKETLTVQVEAGKETPADMAMRLNVGTVKGKVFDDTTKKPLSGVSVSIKNVATVTTDSNGQYTIEKVPVGKQNISFKKENYASDNKTVDVILDVIIPLNIYLKPIDGTIKGTVYDELTKEPLSDVYISCEGLSLSVTTDSKGQYIIEKVPVGKYDISFEKKTFVTEIKKPVSVEPNKITPLDVYLRPEMGTISGTVVDALNNKTLSGVRVECAGHDPVTTDSSGTFIFDNVRVGERSVSFAKEKYRSTSEHVTVEDGKICPLIVPLRLLSGAVGGMVKSEDGEILDGVIVECEDLEGNNFKTSAKSDYQGLYTIKDLPIGMYKCVFSKTGFVTKSIEVVVQADTTRLLDVFMERTTGKLTGIVRDSNTQKPLKNVTVLCFGIGVAVTDSNGKYTIDSIPEGNYKISIVRGGFRSNRNSIFVKAGETHVLDASLIQTDIIEFGVLDQDNNPSEKEPVKWMVLNVGEDGSALAISKYILSYHEWESRMSPYTGIDIIGMDSLEYTYSFSLLSLEEAKTYGLGAGTPTLSALANKKYKGESKKYQESCWWTKITGVFEPEYFGCYVDQNGEGVRWSPGSVGAYGSGVDFGVRPVITMIPSKYAPSIPWDKGTVRNH